jgi:hypothetical protein
MTRTPRGNGLRTDCSAADNYLTHDAGVPAPHEGHCCFVARKLVVLAAQQYACPVRMVGRWCEDDIHSVLTSEHAIIIIILVDPAMTEFGFAEAQ